MVFNLSSFLLAFQRASRDLKAGIVVWGRDARRIYPDQSVPIPGLHNLGMLWMSILMLSSHRNSKGKNYNSMHFLGRQG